MFTLREVIKSKDKKYINYIMKLPSFTILDEEFDNNKDELSQSEMNEINNDLKQRWLK
tara:strand:- start:822 stop:995 length:174 start_codon:yes stop_codon:yes gene_type:complete